MAGSIMQYVLYLAVLVVLAIPLGTYMKKVMYGEKTIFSSIFTPCERMFKYKMFCFLIKCDFPCLYCLYHVCHVLFLLHIQNSREKIKPVKRGDFTRLR